MVFISWTISQELFLVHCPVKYMLEKFYFSVLQMEKEKLQFFFFADNPFGCKKGRQLQFKSKKSRQAFIHETWWVDSIVCHFFQRVAGFAKIFETVHRWNFHHQIIKKPG